ncbi:MAG: M28 family peptidase [Ferruginibacter sp.]
MTKKLFLILPFLIISMGIYAQSDASHYAGMITGDALKKHLTIIASAEMQGRETGTEGQRKAAAYIESQFKSAGLTFPAALKGHQQFYPLYTDSTISVDLKIDDNKLTYGTDYIAPANTNESGKFKGKQLVFAGYGIEDASYNDYSNLDVKNKIVIIFLGEPRVEKKYLVSGTEKTSDWTFPGLNKKLALAASKGAVGVLVVSPNQETFNQRSIDNSRKTNMYYPRPPVAKVLNYAILTHESAKKILGANADSIIAIAKGSRLFNSTLFFDKKAETKFEFEKYRTITNASNVLGVVEGTDKKDEYVFVTGHYDHLGMRNGLIYFGADDDGSGTCAVLQMAEVFAKAKKEGHGPRRTMVFMTVSGEEKGLLGSEYYGSNPVYPLDKTSVDLNIDMIGRVDTERKKDDTLNYVYVVGHDKLSSELTLINEAVNAKNTNLTLDYKFDDPADPERIYFRSDHYNFAKKGVPVLFFYDGMLKADYHKPTDTVDKINFSLYEKRARMVFYTAWDMANRDKMLVRDKPIPTMTK